MKNEFKAYYQSKNELDVKELWKNDKTIFVFDTNVLINLYRYKKETVDDFIKLVKTLRDRVFIPYHVGLEYHRNRLKPIIENRSEINKLSSELARCWDNEKFKKLIDSRSVNKHPSLAKLLQEILQTFDEQKAKVDEEIKNISRKELHVTAQDRIREDILEIFGGNLGKAPENQTWLDELYKEGEERYKNEIPPGYKDQNKDLDGTDSFQYKKLIYKRKFGDLIIWKQILQYVEFQDDIDNVVFITDDLKEDWVYRVNSQGYKVIGARIELIDEYAQVKPAGVFSVYSSDEFIENGNNVFDLEIAEGSVEDVRFNLHEFYERVNHLNNIVPQPLKKLMANDLFKTLHHISTVNNLRSQALNGEIDKKIVEKSQLEMHLKDLFIASNASISLDEYLELEKHIEEIQDQIKNIDLEISELKEGL
ncbi:hypothetical protein GCM10007161_17940 [Ignatzschineria indica]|uniref:PIN like domain-containing protein n=1 Tax=Ignatzschineria indica TaxID=472583 RepID=A0A2U2AJ91_9GAMM|nr:PIN domain-containing protein [Ignatzschineria indica]PWD82741.1 hypothetical protein DC082_09025 [Ignatzschineria indica]GGZ86466.1 hypothetical protein GCM10007161_17940 [Ignatzschineria indica]